MRPLFKTIATSAFLLLPHTSGLPNEHQIPQTNCPQTTITQAENFSEEVLPSLQTLQQETQQHVYLTIDDGPGKYTQKIIEALDSLGHKATFFFIGENIKEQQRKTLLQLLNS